MQLRTSVQRHSARFGPRRREKAGLLRVVSVCCKESIDYIETTYVGANRLRTGPWAVLPPSAASASFVASSVQCYGNQKGGDERTSCCCMSMFIGGIMFGSSPERAEQSRSEVAQNITESIDLAVADCDGFGLAECLR